MAERMSTSSERGRVVVTSDQVAADLMTDANDYLQKQLMSAKPRGSSNGSSYGSEPARTRKMKSVSERTFHSPRMTTSRFLRHWPRAAVSMNDELQRYSIVLEDEEKMKELTASVEQKDFLKERKKELLYHKWNSKLYLPMKKQASSLLDVKFDQLRSTKSEQYKQYLEYCNKKGSAPLDDFDPVEYNPLEMQPTRPGPLWVPAHGQKDPTLTTYRNRNEEDRSLLQCMNGNRYADWEIEQFRKPVSPLVPLGRPVEQIPDNWDRLKLVTIDSRDRAHSQRRLRPTRTNGSQVDFEEWSKTQVTQDLLEKEAGMSKRRMFHRPIPMNPTAPSPLIPFAFS